MRRAKKATYLGTAERNSEAERQLKKPGDCAVVHRGYTRAVVMACPDGCGTKLTINLDQRTGKAWRLYFRSEKLSIYPSYWRTDGCLSHFIVWRNRIIWCDVRRDFEPPNVSPLLSTVLAKVPVGSYISHETIAAQIDEVPWDVLWSCRSLVRMGLVMKHPNAGLFKRPPVNESGPNRQKGSG